MTASLSGRLRTDGCEVNTPVAAMAAHALGQGACPQMAMGLGTRRAAADAIAARSRAHEGNGTAEAVSMFEAEGAQPATSR